MLENKFCKYSQNASDMALNVIFFYLQERKKLPTIFRQKQSNRGRKLKLFLSRPSGLGDNFLNNFSEGDIFIGDAAKVV